MLNYYRQLLAMRHTKKALLEGSYTALNENDENVLSYIRSYKGENVLVVLNMSGTQKNVHLDLAAERVAASKQRLAQFIRSTHGSEC